MRLPMLLLIGCALPLAACSSPPPKTADEPPQAVVDPVPAGSEGITPCRPEALQGLEGKLADTATVDKAVKDSGAKHARVVKPNMAVTMDFREDRLTIQVDAQNRITSINCG
ncbi:hypothetical protein J7J08_06190 [Stenotrophomonas sp. ISL-67]|uniref:I78 family peptidase inhibitor n=1 Tax=Stenotrophomonas sp. ISL-67 TaxID=2819171 RepID=UPI001BEC2E07|nr:I78 family peptidase inhibitor [Stenotrophomonas sp. ISL-67]MBT2767220.1 hypothetical protein [Stenotrophomonas sp. ISL-67]